MEQLRDLQNLCEAKADTYIYKHRRAKCAITGWSITNTFISAVGISFTAMASTASVMLTPALIAGGGAFVSAQVLTGCNFREKSIHLLNISKSYSNVGREIQAFVRRQNNKREAPQQPQLQHQQHQGHQNFGGGQRLGTGDVDDFHYYVKQRIGLLDDSAKLI